jgi:hypothetical protein
MSSWDQDDWDRVKVDDDDYDNSWQNDTDYDYVTSDDDDFEPDEEASLDDPTDDLTDNLVDQMPSSSCQKHHTGPADPPEETHPPKMAKKAKHKAKNWGKTFQSS